MYLAIEFIDAGRGVRLITRGRVPGVLIVDAHRIFVEKHLETFSRSSYWFSDHTMLKAALLDQAHARSVATLCIRLAQANPSLVVGNLVPGDLEFGMVRTWQSLADATGWRVGTFRGEAKLRAFFEATVGRAIELHAPADAAPVLVYQDSDVASY